ncbi:MAG: LptF/LptG family permease [Phycisphaerae bacterium]|nr:LptF/LptG family permease [Gemmatimonadaceae bacterium]
MKILTRYVLKEHIGPLIFALAALTSLLMLQFVARQLGNFVGKGVPWSAIGEFFVLSLPFTVAMTLPMAVLVATLHAFGRMATEHEITAFKASGVRVSTLMWPVIIGASVLALGMVVFNDQVLPRANHRLRVLQQDMSRTKPTLALNEQTLNQVTNGFYMRIGKLDRESNRMKDVTIYDLSDPYSRKTIYADSGDMAFTPNKKDLQLMLFDGYQQQLDGHATQKMTRAFFRSQAVRVKDIGNQFEQTGNDEWKGDREKSICEMQSEYAANAGEHERVRQIYIDVARKSAKPGQKTLTVPRPRGTSQGLGRLYCNGLALIFRVPTAVPSISPLGQPTDVALASPPAGAPSTGAPQPGTLDSATGLPPGTPALSAAMQAQLDAEKARMAQQAQQQVDLAAIQAVTPQPPAVVASSDSAKAVVVPAGVKPDSTVSPIPPAVTIPGQVPPVVVPPTPGQPVTTQPQAIPTPGVPGATVVVPGTAAVPPPVTGQPAMPAVPPAVVPPSVPVGSPAVAGGVGDPMLSTLAVEGGPAALGAAASQLGIVRGYMDSLAVEIHKKFALSFACIVFVLFGPPIALRFPRGGVGATLGVSLIVFGLYYVCLMAGETLADNGKLPPAIAMWMANVIFTCAGLVLLLRIEKTADASRGGGIRAWFENRKARRSIRAVRMTVPSAAT